MKSVTSVHFDNEAANRAIYQCLQDMTKDKKQKRLTIGAILMVAMDRYDCFMPPDIPPTEYNMIVNELMFALKKVADEQHK